jgi:hypothetical protein
MYWSFISLVHRNHKFLLAARQSRKMVLEDDFFFFIFLNNNNNNNTSFKSLLSIEQRRRRDRCIPRIALVDPSESAWVKLYCSGSDSAMITLTGLDYPSFNYLSAKFEDLYNEYTPYSHSGRIILKRQRGRFRRPRIVGFLDVATEVWRLRLAALPLAVPALNAPVLEVDGLLVVVVSKIADKFVLAVAPRAEVLVPELGIEVVPEL